MAMLLDVGLSIIHGLASEPQTPPNVTFITTMLLLFFNGLRGFGDVLVYAETRPIRLCTGCAAR